MGATPPPLPPTQAQLHCGSLGMLRTPHTRARLDNELCVRSNHNMDDDATIAILSHETPVLLLVTVDAAVSAGIREERSSRPASRTTGGSA